MGAAPPPLSDFGQARDDAGKPSIQMIAASSPKIRPGLHMGKKPGPGFNATLSSQAALIAIFFSAFCASAFLGNVTESKPFLKAASILSLSTPSGTSKE